MSIDFQQIHIDFHTFNTRGQNIETRFFGEHTFHRRIRKAVAAISAFELFFTQSDHNIKNILVGAEALIDDANNGTVTDQTEVR